LISEELVKDTPSGLTCLYRLAIAIIVPSPLRLISLLASVQKVELSELSIELPRGAHAVPLSS
jgi:hypothetical protein